MVRTVYGHIQIKQLTECTRLLQQILISINMRQYTNECKVYYFDSGFLLRFQYVFFGGGGGLRSILRSLVFFYFFFFGRVFIVSLHFVILSVLTLLYLFMTHSSSIRVVICWFSFFSLLGFVYYNCYVFSDPEIFFSFLFYTLYH